jgi:hypothetical protein
VARSEFASARPGIRAFLTDWYDVLVQETLVERLDWIVLFSLQLCQLFTGRLSSGIAQLLICECKIWFADMFNLIETTPYMNCKYGRALEGVASLPVAVGTQLRRSSMPENRFLRFLILGDKRTVTYTEE